MSEMTKSARPDRNFAPITLAAGPERMVSIGRCATASASASVPSPFTIISGASTPCRCMETRTAATSATMRAMMRAFSAAVSARRGASSAWARSLESVVGRPVSSAASARTRRSWAGLRTE